MTRQQLGMIFVLVPSLVVFIAVWRVVGFWKFIGLFGILTLISFFYCVGFYLLNG
jgi:hypothetical protein